MLSLLRRRRLPSKALLGVFSAVLVSACASVLGIEDPLDLPADDSGLGDLDGGLDSTLTPDRIEADRDLDAGSSADQAAPPPDGGTDATSEDAGHDSGNPNEPCSQVCAVAPPPSWDGPFAYDDVTGGPPAPSAAPCSGEYSKTSFNGQSDLVAPAASCGCECGAAAGVTCKASVSFFSDMACNNPCGGAIQTVESACKTFDLSGCSGTRATIGAVTASGGSCPPNPSKSVTPADFSRRYRLCSPPAPRLGKCDTGKVCVPPPQLPQRPGVLCIATTGDLACPSDYPKKRIAYQGFTDDRGCSTCSCNAPAGTCTTAQSTFYGDAICGSGPKNFSVPQSCFATNGKSGALVSPVVNASCTPQGGAPIGSATPTTPTTICCNDQ